MYTRKCACIVTRVSCVFLFQAKLAKLRRELLEPASGGGGAAGVGFDVSKVGDSRVGLVGGWAVSRAPVNVICRLLNLMRGAKGCVHGAAVVF